MNLGKKTCPLDLYVEQETSTNIDPQSLQSTIVSRSKEPTLETNLATHVLNSFLVLSSSLTAVGIYEFGIEWKGA